MIENNENADENIIGFDALYNSMWKCKKGVVWKSSVAHYVLNAVEETIKLERQLKDGTYKSRPPMKFQITHPTPRECLSIAFRERVYQRSMNDNVIYPAMCNQFIYDNAACQKNKGTDFARDRLVCFLQKMYRKHGLNFYVAQFDIKGYYPNMRHDVAKAAFKNVLNETVYNRAEKVLGDQYDGEIGYNPGSQMIQIAGISVLDPLDHFIKERLHIKFYLRYMDDLIPIHENKQNLKNCYTEIEKQLNNIGFMLHEKKSKIYPIKQGIKFLGFTFRVTDTGKVLMLINKKNVQAEKQKLRRIAAKVKRGEMTREKADSMYNAWREHAAAGWNNRKDKYWRQKKQTRKRHGKAKHNNQKVLEYMDKFYKNLWSAEP